MCASSNLRFFRDMYGGDSLRRLHFPQTKGAADGLSTGRAHGGRGQRSRKGPERQCDGLPSARSGYRKRSTLRQIGGRQRKYESCGCKEQDAADAAARGLVCARKELARKTEFASRTPATAPGVRRHRAQDAEDERQDRIADVEQSIDTLCEATP